MKTFPSRIHPWGCMAIVVSCFYFTGAMLPAPVAAATLEVGPGQTYALPSAAFTVAAPGDSIEIHPGTYDGDVAIIHTSDLTIRGIGPDRIKIPAAGKNAGGKAIWVAAGDNLTIENIEFSGARVPDRNGAGIRAEGANLTLRNCRFYDCEDGILGGNGLMLIEHCEFAHCGPVANPATHSLYIGNRCTKLIFQYNYSTDVIQGHLLKTRAAENWILYNRLTDEDGTGSAVIDIPNGGYAVILGNVLQKGKNAQNTRVIAYGMEGIKYDRNALYVVNNTMVYENHRPNAFFVNVQNAPDGFLPVIRNNLCTGIIPLTNCPNAVLGGNVLLQSVEDALFVDPSQYDYHLTAGSPAIGKGTAVSTADGVELTPKFQYVHPATMEPRPAANPLDAGAFAMGAGKQRVLQHPGEISDAPPASPVPGFASTRLREGEVNYVRAALNVTATPAQLTGP